MRFERDIVIGGRWRSVLLRLERADAAVLAAGRRRGATARAIDVELTFRRDAQRRRQALQTAVEIVELERDKVSAIGSSRAGFRSRSGKVFEPGRTAAADDRR